MLVESVLNGDDPPLVRCEESDAWRYRRELEVPRIAT